MIEKRIEGYDLARAIAIFGMVIVHFQIAMTDDTLPTTLSKMTSLLQGRAAAVFVMLAGVGITLMTKSAYHSKNPIHISQKRKSLLKRSFIFFIIGLINTTVWQADILHFYSMYFLAAAFIFTYSTRSLIIIASVLPLIFVALLFIFDYNANWDFDDYHYHNMYTIKNMIYHLFFNGYHPVFPWLTFLIIGMILARLDIQNPKIQRKLILITLIVFFITEAFTYTIRQIATSFATQIPKTELPQYQEILEIITTNPMPPLPMYIISASASAICIITLCIILAQKYADNPVLAPLYSTGKLALTLYIAHIIIGLGAIEQFGLLNDQSIQTTLIAAAIFIILSIVFSHIYLKIFRHGPLEALFRKIAN